MLGEVTDTTIEDAHNGCESTPSSILTAKRVTIQHTEESLLSIVSYRSLFYVVYNRKSKH